MSTGAVVSSDGSTGWGPFQASSCGCWQDSVPSGWWTEAGSRLLVGGPLSSFYMGLSIGQLTTWQLTFLRTSEWEGEQDGSRSLLWPTIGSDIPHSSLPLPLRMGGINTRALIPGSGETWGLLGGCIPHSGIASPHTCPPNPLSKGTILVTTSKSFLSLFPLHPQPELNSTSTKAFSL